LISNEENFIKNKQAKEKSIILSKHFHFTYSKIKGRLMGRPLYK